MSTLPAVSVSPTTRAAIVDAFVAAMGRGFDFAELAVLVMHSPGDQCQVVRVEPRAQIAMALGKFGFALHPDLALVPSGAGTTWCAEVRGHEIDITTITHAGVKST